MPLNTLKITNPATGQAIQTLPIDTAKSIKFRFESARAAQPVWAALPFAERIGIMEKLRDRLAAESADLASILTTETGTPIAQSRCELVSVLEYLDAFIAAAPRALGCGADGDTASGGMRGSVTIEPLGVIASISTWSHPYLAGCKVFIPALLAGNAVLYKPSEYATLPGLAIARLLHQSGVPEDIFSSIIGHSNMGEELLRYGLDGVFFTGSRTNGRRIVEALGGRMPRLQLELGGKNPVYVCEDADIANAAVEIARGAFMNSGQDCRAVSLIYVHENIGRPFLAAFADEVKRYRPGDPMNNNTLIGPIVVPERLARLNEYLADAQALGAKLLVGGRRAAGEYRWFEPLVLAGVNHGMTIMRRDNNAPIAGIMTVAGDTEALEQMNDSHYRLSAAVFSRTRERAEKILAGTNCDSAYWNCCARLNPGAPWTNAGSGLLPVSSIRSFTRLKAWY